jgi:replicative DNA helicase
MEQASFSKHGKDFQEKLVYLIMTERPFCDQIGEVLDVSFLELKYLQVLVSKIYEYKEKYTTHPSLKVLGSIIKSDISSDDEAVQEQIADYFKRSLTDVEILRDCEYVKETSLDFCKKQKLKEAMMKSVKLLNNSSFDEISTVINDAIKLGADSNYGYDYKKDFEERYLLKARNPVTTGWDKIDEICKGGLGNGELGVVIAPTGAGKSMVLVHLGAQAIKAGLNVIHYTLELSHTTIGQRYDSCLTGVHLKDLFSLKEQIYEKVKDIDGNVIIKEYPTKSASTSTIRAHLDKLKQQGVPIDMIIVDYGDLLKPVNAPRGNEKRHDLESIYEELRAIAQVCECPVWTASQTNRSGLNAELITMEAISESFNKCFVADFIFSLSRTITDKAKNRGKIFIAKNRNGRDGIPYTISMDTSNIKLKVIESDLEDASQKPDAKKQKEKINQYYKEFKK